jgi:peptidoglycan biosynthesis protein MviN/MurJ (putative lipid II flippase)
VITTTVERVQELIIKLKARPNVTAIALLAFWGIASRALGAIRILLVGQLSSQEADIFNAAFVLPDNIIAIFILGSISLAILPHIIELHNDNNSDHSDHTEEERAEATVIANAKETIYLTHVTFYLSVFILLVTVLALVFAAPLLRTLNPKLQTSLIELGQWEEYLTLTRILLLAPMIFALKTIFGTFLNARRKFGVYATDGVITNLGILFGLTILYYSYGIQGAVWGVIIGFSLSTIAFAVDAFHHGLRFNIGSFDGLNNYLQKTIILYTPRLLIIPAIRIAETMVTLTAAEANGEITALKTALDLQGIPLGIVSVAAIVFLPDITGIFLKSGYGKELTDLLKKYLRYGTIFSILGFVGVTAGAPIAFWALAQLGLIRDGSFFDSADNIRLIVICTGVTSLTLVFQTMVELYNRVYVALKNASIPLISSLTGNIAGIALTLILAPRLGAALGTSIAFSINSIIQSVIVVYFLPRVGNRTNK